MKKRLLTALLSGFFLVLSSSIFAQSWAPGTTTWEKLPEIKRTRLGLYLSPQQALDMKQKDPRGVALFDVRTRAEAMYVGMPGAADALTPFVEHPELMTDWDDKRASYKLDPNQDFLPELERRLAALGLDRKDAPIILICRSGDRSAKAVDRLATAGYTKVYSVTEGFEGDTATGGDKTGQRVINGWKNAGLPWSYKLDKTRMYFQR